jgi:hypothetical protein
LRSLPKIAREPVRPQGGGFGKPGGATLRSPYLRANDELHQTLYFLPPVSPRGPSASQTATAPRKGDDEDASGETAQDATSASKPADGEAMHVNELTRTYLKVLQRSEDYSRRTLQKDRDRSMKNAERPWRRLNEHVLHVLSQFDNVKHTETAARKKLNDEESRARESLHSSEAHSRTDAKRHEDIRPTCPLINDGQSVHLDPKHANAMTVELRWRGGSDIDLHFFLFDESDRLISVGSRSDIVRGMDSTVGIRQVSAVNATPLGTGGSRTCFQVHLVNLTAKCHRVALVGFAKGKQEHLRDMTRTWLTLFETGKNASHLSKEVYACSGLDGGNFSAFALGSLTRRTGNVWIFGCRRECILGGFRPLDLAPRIPLLFKNASEFASVHFGMSREVLINQAMAPLEDAPRQLITLEEDEARTKLVVLHRFEFQRAHKRSVQAQGMRAFSRSSATARPM